MLSFRGSRSSDRGARKDKRARSRSSSSRDRGRRSRSRSFSRLRSRGRERRRRSSWRSLSSRVRSRRGLLTATALDVCALILGEAGLDPRIDTGIALGVTGRGLLTATGHVVSVRVPQLAGEVAVTRSTTFLP